MNQEKKNEYLILGLNPLKDNSMIFSSFEGGGAPAFISIYGRRQSKY